jgi:hypothetical protein
MLGLLLALAALGFILVHGSVAGEGAAHDAYLGLRDWLGEAGVPVEWVDSYAANSVDIVNTALPFYQDCARWGGALLDDFLHSI